jgi:hypothetical protein
VPLTQTSAAGQLLAWINLDLNWLAQHYAERFDSSNLTLLIADRQGTVLVRLPDNNKWAGKPMGEQFSSLLNASQEGVVETVGIDGEERYIAYSPLAAHPLASISASASQKPPTCSRSTSVRYGRRKSASQSCSWR